MKDNFKFFHISYILLIKRFPLPCADVDDCALKDLELWHGWFMSCTFKGIMRYQKSQSQAGSLNFQKQN